MPTEEVLVPDIGDFQSVDVIEILVSPGDRVREDDSLLTLESDKATMELPSPFSGVVRELKVAVGDKVAKGSLILTMERDESQPSAEAPQGPAPDADKTPPPASAPQAQQSEPAAEQAVAPQPPPGTAPDAPPPAGELPKQAPAEKPHASPAVRRMARELGVDLQRVSGSGPKGRILKQDVQQFVKGVMQQAPGAAGGLAVAAQPVIDFSQFGEIETRPLSRIQKISGPHLHRSWVSIPHVTQFDEADITELEAFRNAQLETLGKQGVKLTLLAFVLKAVVATLRHFPQVNASLDPGGEQLVVKKYFHIGVAVDTAEGLVVPVVRNVDAKGLIELARELAELSTRARDRQLRPTDMQGGTFTVSSLGGLGGTGFTPIINAPEVAVLGVARAAMRPVYRDGAFVPRLVLPFSLSYDHRVVDGADAVRFTAMLAASLSDVRRLLL